MALFVHLLRHGETVYSRTGGYCGDLDPDLTTEGVQMAHAFSAAYRHKTWEAVYVSPMQRALQTASPLCETLGLPMQLRAGLREIGYGVWEGKTNPDVKVAYAEDYERWLAEPAWNAPTGGETAIHVASRAMAVLIEIQEQHQRGNVLLVSHKATIRLILCSLLGIDLGRYRDRINILTASVSVIKFSDHGPLLELLNDRSHLSAELLALYGT